MVWLEETKVMIHTFVLPELRPADLVGGSHQPHPAGGWLYGVVIASPSAWAGC